MTARKTEKVYDDNPAHPGHQCVHCKRTCGTLAGGFARIAGASVCCKPSQTGRPDCYHMITVKFHPIRDCPSCTDRQPQERPTPPRGGPGPHRI